MFFLLFFSILVVGALISVEPIEVRLIWLGIVVWINSVFWLLIDLVMIEYSMLFTSGVVDSIFSGFAVVGSNFFGFAVVGISEVVISCLSPSDVLIFGFFDSEVVGPFFSGSEVVGSNFSGSDVVISCFSEFVNSGISSLEVVASCSFGSEWYVVI